MSARVISGSAKGRRLKLVPGDKTRPIMDRVKENLFNILGQDVAGQRWLDLFAGTGQVGIEALSRGAAEAVFVDNARGAINTVRANLETTNLVTISAVHKSDASHYLRHMTGEPFDVIYVAPPQYKAIWQDILLHIDRETERLLAADGQAIVQIDPLEFIELELTNLELIDKRRYGNTLLCFYQQ